MPRHGVEAFLFFKTTPPVATPAYTQQTNGENPLPPAVHKAHPQP